MTKTVIEMTRVSPKKHSVRFDADERDMPVMSIYIANEWVQNNDAEGGVRVTIEPIVSQ